MPHAYSRKAPVIEINYHAHLRNSADTRSPRQVGTEGSGRTFFTPLAHMYAHASRFKSIEGI